MVNTFVPNIHNQVQRGHALHTNPKGETFKMGIISSGTSGSHLGTLHSICRTDESVINAKLFSPDWCSQLPV